MGNYKWRENGVRNEKTGSYLYDGSGGQWGVSIIFRDGHAYELRDSGPEAGWGPYIITPRKIALRLAEIFQP